MLAKAPPERELEKVRTTCNYCGVGCQMDLNVDPNANNGKGKVVKIIDPGTTTNDETYVLKEGLHMILLIIKTE